MTTATFQETYPHLVDRFPDLETPGEVYAFETRKQLQDRAREIYKEQHARPQLYLYDKDWEFLCDIHGEIEGDFEEKLLDSGEGSIKVFGDNPIIDYVLDGISEDEDVHIRIDLPGKRWTGKATTVEYDGGGSHDYVTINFLHEYEHIKKIICYSNPLLPAEFQWPKHFLFAGPSVAGMRTLVFLNLLRRFGPLWALPENIYSAESWRLNLDPNRWPITVTPQYNFFTDTSAWSVLSTRFGNAHDVMLPTARDAGVQTICKRWFPGDPQPFPNHATLTKSTLVIDFVDKSGVRGPTGTPLDGLFRVVSTILEDGVSEVREILDPGAPPPEYGTPGYFGTVNTYPWVNYRHGQRTGLSGISSWKMTVHKPLAGAILTGGKSPSWVNAGIKLLINAVLGWLGMLFGNPALGIGIFDDQVEDVVLAFHRVPHVQRQALMGRGQYGEAWESGGGTGFSISALQSIRAGLWRTRAFTSYSLTVNNGAPYWVGRHFDVGDRIVADVKRNQDGLGALYVDQVESTKVSWSRTSDTKVEIQLGERGASDTPGAALSKQLENVRTIIQALGVDS